MSDELAGLSDTDLASIRQIYRTMAETTLNGDWDGWASILEEHAVVVPPNQEPVVGRGTLRDWIEGFGTFISHDITPHEIEGRGDLAFVRLRADVEVRLEDGSVVTDHARGMNILSETVGWIVEAQSHALEFGSAGRRLTCSRSDAER